MTLLVQTQNFKVVREMTVIEFFRKVKDRFDNEHWISCGLLTGDCKGLFEEMVDIFEAHPRTGGYNTGEKK